MGDNRICQEHNGDACIPISDCEQCREKEIIKDNSKTGDIELKPCPFCGGKAFFIDNYVNCKCGAVMEPDFSDSTREETSILWNKRTEPKESKGEN